MRGNVDTHVNTGPVRTSSISADAASVESMPELARLLRELHRREARRRGGTALTYRELAKVTGWSRGIIGEYLSGTALPPTNRFDQLVQILGATKAEWGPLATARDRIEEQRRQGRSTTRAVPASPLDRVPRELPAPVPGFVGRGSQLRELDRLAAANRGALVVAAICGGGGVGKTALAVRWAQQAADRFPDGHLYIDLHGYGTMRPVDAGDALGRFLQALGFEPARLPADTDARATLYRSMLAGRRMLVLLDNATSADQVRPLLPGSSSCMVMVTSRDSLAGLVAADGAHRIGVDVLTEPEAWTLLRELLGNRVDTAPDAASTLVRLCGRLPLALRVAAEVAGARATASLTDLVAGLRDQRTLLDVLDAGEPHCAVRSVLSWSYRTLSPAAARLFRLFGCEPGPDLSIPAAASLAGTTTAAAWRLLAELTRAHMITEVAPGRFAPHDVMRAYAAERLHETDPGTDRRAALRRLLDHYAHTATLAGAALNPSRVRMGGVGTLDDAAGPAAAVDGAVVTPVDCARSALTWFEAERPALLAATRLARDSGDAGDAGRLAWAMADYLDREGYWREWAECGELALDAADTPVARARAHWSLAGASARLHRFDAAREHHERACEQYRLAGDGPGEAATYLSLSDLQVRAGRLTDALGSRTRALDLYRGLGDDAGQAASRGAIGQLHALLGDYPSALAECGESLTGWWRIGDRAATAPVLDCLGYVNHRTGRHDDAIRHYRAALALYEQGERRRSQAAVWTRLGEVYSDTGREEAAREAWRTALSILDDLGHADAADVRTRLAASQCRARA